MNYKKDFIKFMSESGVLTFGDFTAKSGRKTPYFVNTGNYRTGAQISKLGDFYARLIMETDLKPDVLFGPAYKGIPLCVAASIALHDKSVEVDYCFNRKEAKNHGEGGTLVGRKLSKGDRVLIIEDVITAGTSIKESIPLIRGAGAEPVGVVISVDRMERAAGEKSAVEQVYEDYGIKVYSIINVLNIIECMRHGDISDGGYLKKMLQYREKYGVL